MERSQERSRRRNLLEPGQKACALGSSQRGQSMEFCTSADGQISGPLQIGKAVLHVSSLLAGIFPMRVRIGSQLFVDL